MNKKYTKFIIGGSVLLAIIILIIVYHNVTKIDKNSSSTTGNTPGNLLNGGSFCESGGKIYFPTLMTITSFIPWTATVPTLSVLQMTTSLILTVPADTSIM